MLAVSYTTPMFKTVGSYTNAVQVLVTVLFQGSCHPQLIIQSQQCFTPQHHSLPARRGLLGAPTLEQQLRHRMAAVAPRQFDTANAVCS